MKNAYLCPVASRIELVDDDFLVVANVNAVLEIASSLGRYDGFNVFAFG